MRCSRVCGALKPLEQFCTSSKRPGGRGSCCQDRFNLRFKAGYASARRRREAGRPGLPLDPGRASTLPRLRVEQAPDRFPICGVEDPRHVEHDHRTDRLRGILCFNCNGGLGQFRDDPEFLANAITYLKGTTWQPVLTHPGVFQMCSPTRGRLPSRSS
ncbi:endonuclease domain-containing protein [Actinoplanes sp. TFC3]|uniref:endonuclease domain-containing protein n=1 Tax=Actinoplanes sp. TFC3 TaxID=1710355 RepID=UPI0009E9D1D4